MPIVLSNLTLPEGLTFVGETYTAPPGQAQYTTPASVTYTVQLAPNGSDFSNAQDLSTTTNRNVTITEMNPKRMRKCNNSGNSEISAGAGHKCRASSESDSCGLCRDIVDLIGINPLQ